MKTIALMTDFTGADVGVGVMKGVVGAICRDAVCVDLCHGIPAMDEFRGALFLRNSVRWFSPGTVFVAVVDPGVGSGRRALAIRVGDHVLIGPDNGILHAACTLLGQACQARAPEAYCIVNRDLCLSSPTGTFDGRDVFAPVAAHIANGVPVEDVGPRVTDWVQMDVPSPKMEASSGRGEIISIDRFGNLMTNIEPKHFQERGWLPANCRVSIADSAMGGDAKLRIVRTFSEVPEGCGLAYFGSWGFLEIALNADSAAGKWGTEVGTPVAVFHVERDTK